MRTVMIQHPRDIRTDTNHLARIYNNDLWIFTDTLRTKKKANWEWCKLGFTETFKRNGKQSISKKKRIWRSPLWPEYGTYRQLTLQLLFHLRYRDRIIFHSVPICLWLKIKVLSESPLHVSGRMGPWVCCSVSRLKVDIWTAEWRKSYWSKEIWFRLKLLSDFRFSILTPSMHFMIG